MKVNKSFFTKSKFRHGTSATIFTAIFIAIIFVINVFSVLLETRYPSLSFDMTADQIHTLSEESEEVAEGVTMETTIYIIGTEETIKANSLYSSYGIEYSQVATLAEKLAEANSKISVTYIDPDINPDFLAKYTEELTTGSVVVQSEERYKVLSVTDFFAIYTDDYGTETLYTMVDGAYANALYITNLEEVPVVAIPTGHDELFSETNRETLVTLLNNNGFDVVEFDISLEEVPEEAQILLIATPTTDYSEDEIAKLEEFIAYIEEYRAVFVTSYPTQGELPNLEGFLEEWGIGVNDGVVVEGDTTKALTTTGTSFYGTLNAEYISEDLSYSRYVVSDAVSLELLFSTSNDIATYPLVETSDLAYVTSTDGLELDEEVETGTLITSALARRLNNADSGVTYSTVVVLGDTVPLLSSILGTSSYSNSDFTVQLFKAISGTSDSNLSLYIEEIETNALDIVASWATIMNVGLYCFTIGVPLAILIMGLVIFLKRRHL